MLAAGIAALTAIIKLGLDTSHRNRYMSRLSGWLSF
jgi:hypothetical protein